MVSLESVKTELAEAQGRILILMQEGDEGGNTGDFLNVEWADEMYDAYEHVKKAIQSLNRAGDWE